MPGTRRTPLVTELIQGLLDELRVKSYSDGTLMNYDHLLSMLASYMHVNVIEVYTSEIGKEFVTDYFSKHELRSSRKKAILTIVNRFSDYCNNISYVIQRKHEKLPLTEEYDILLEAYLLFCKSNGNKAGTLETKKSCCSRFLVELLETGCYKISEWTSSCICKSCIVFKNKDAWAEIRLFLKFIHNSGRVAADYSTLVPHYKKPIIIPTVYSEEEIRRFEAAIDRGTAIGKRDYAMLLPATRLGLRSGDIVKMTIDELDFEQGTINITQEKTGQPLSLIMLPEIKTAIRDYIENARPNSATNYLFLRKNAPFQQITTSTIRYAATKYFKAAGIKIAGKKHGPHSFRSSLTSSMINDGVPYEAVRGILGHEDPDAIKHYAKIDLKKLRECAIAVPEPTGAFKEFLEGGWRHDAF